MMKRCCLLLLLGAVLLLCLCHESNAQLPKKAIASARKEDVKYIKCGVCEEIVKQLTRQVKKKKEKIAPKKLTELDIINLAENICNLKKEEADWLMFFDLVEEGDKLKLVEQAEEGECNTECRTLERACQEVMGDHDTDVAEFMYKGNVQRAAVSKFLCKDLSKACVGKPPPLPKNRETGPPFSPKPSKDAEMERIMRSMSDMPGAPGMQMFSKEELMKRRFGSEDEDDDDEEEEDDQADQKFTNVAKEHLKKSRSASGIKEQAQAVFGKLKSGLKEAADALRYHAGKFWRSSSVYLKTKPSLPLPCHEDPGLLIRTLWAKEVRIDIETPDRL
ncbi:hypothetical protein AXG93_3661s1150 [Marchantia polymorpha subsp. ruderalis]|uniref:Saposin B-type domain-containing protein n=1 Tax=Marchantia polymorpha subsp. ruderalis TaxID=1480154 RepID=A0A176VJN4_MARPO|nr:hypothetical protein AXG93_3661s1150 [Marchantia polymorpha subsp. ruderalis]